MTRREFITKKIIGYLSNISTANGYLTNAGTIVKHWDTQITPNRADVDMDINVRDISNEHIENHIETLNFQFILSCKNSDNYSKLNKMISDVQKALTDENNLIDLQSSVNSRVRWRAIAEEIEKTRENDTEIAYASVTMALDHRYTEKFEPDFTNYQEI